MVAYFGTAVSMRMIAESVSSENSGRNVYYSLTFDMKRRRVVTVLIRCRESLSLSLACVS